MVAGVRAAREEPLYTHEEGNSHEFTPRSHAACLSLLL